MREIGAAERGLRVSVERHLIYEAFGVQCGPAAPRHAHEDQNRAEVSGSGRKLWRQKGTGRARVGEIAPLWRHGGTVFGPQPRDYAYAMPREARRRAALRAVAEACATARSWSRPLRARQPQDEGCSRALDQLGVERQGAARGRAVPQPRSRSRRATSRRLKVVDASQLNVYDVLDHDRSSSRRRRSASWTGVRSRHEEPLEVIRRPLITEKSTLLKETQGTSSASRSHRDANKIEIKKAVETLFRVKVAEVRVANVHGKVKRQGRYVGRRPDWKKAYVASPRARR